jgi:hypothetical protein
MINASMRTYDYYTFGAKDEYGQQILSDEIQGSVKMAIFTTSQGIQDNINYKDASYIGLTRATVDDSYVIQYGEEKLKVLYIQPHGRLKQVFLQLI